MKKGPSLLRHLEETALVSRENKIVSRVAELVGEQAGLNDASKAELNNVLRNYSMLASVVPN